MKVTIHRSSVRGKVIAPSSKSYTHRALICSALARGKSRIISPLISDDTEATLEILRKLRVRIRKSKEFWEIEGRPLQVPKEDLFCGESGTTMRFMTAFCSLVNEKCRLIGGPSLSKRPIKPLVDGLKQLGIDCSCNGDFPPVIVEGTLKGGRVKIPGNISSQFISALLLVAPLAKKDVKIELTTPLESKPYVLMTMETQREFGVNIEASEDLEKFWIERQKYQSTTLKVEGDWSSAAFLLAAGSIAGMIKVDNLNTKSLQADREILNILQKMKARVFLKKNSVVVEKSELSPIKFNVSNCPDLFPVVCVLCSLAKGMSVISGVERLRIKESDRIAAMKEGLTKMGIKLIEKKDRILINGSKPSGTIIDPKNDHRIAMAFAILGLATEKNTVIRNAECVSKSFPEFWKVLQNLGAKIEVKKWMEIV